jgi:K+-sensing histidine kinase KdpD
VNASNNTVKLGRDQAAALLSSARWMQYCIRKGEIGVNPDERRTALAELQGAVDGLTEQLGRGPRHERLAQWWAYVAASVAVCAVTVLIEACYLAGTPRTVVGLYIPVVIGTALFFGRWPALLGCALAFVLNDVLFVHPWRFSPSPEQIAALSVVVLSCMVVDWLTRTQIQVPRRLAVV